MRNMHAVALSTFLAAGVLAAPMGSVFAQTCTCPSDQEGSAGVTVYADEAPPPLPEYDQPPIPAAGYLWAPGYWAWNSYEYFWVPGTWIEPPQPGLLWTPGYWAFVNGTYAFHRGYWGEHVGFYGGVDYGFGYVGIGYEGGRWDNGRFFYNRSVTNIGEIKITEVYDRPVTPRGESRASFNGGPDGVDAKPTAEELEAAKEKHVAPTHDQLNNARLASRNEAAFATTNHGKPRIAATAKPGVFEGSAVVHAKAAGGPLEREKPAKPEPTKAGDKTPGETTPKAEKTLEPRPDKSVEPKPEKTLEPKSDKTVEPKVEKTVEPKSDKTVEPRPEKSLEPKPEPTKLERPKPEPTKSEPMQIKPDNKPEQRRVEPTPKSEPRGKPEEACGHPGERACPK
jgi:hypothetical protein